MGSPRSREWTPKLLTRLQLSPLTRPTSPTTVCAAPLSLLRWFVMWFVRWSFATTVPPLSLLLQPSRRGLSCVRRRVFLLRRSSSPACVARLAALPTTSWTAHTLCCLVPCAGCAANASGSLLTRSLRFLVLHSFPTFFLFRSTNQSKLWMGRWKTPSRRHCRCARTSVCTSTSTWTSTPLCAASSPPNAWCCRSEQSLPPPPRAPRGCLS